MTRADAPLKPAEDAVILDTSEMTVDEAVTRALALVETVLGGRKP
jgi:cytidylate kinase